MTSSGRTVRTDLVSMRTDLRILVFPQNTRTSSNESCSYSHRLFHQCALSHSLLAGYFSKALIEAKNSQNLVNRFSSPAGLLGRQAGRQAGWLPQSVSPFVSQSERKRFSVCTRLASLSLPLARSLVGRGLFSISVRWLAGWLADRSVISWA